MPSNVQDDDAEFGPAFVVISIGETPHRVTRGVRVSSILTVLAVTILAAVGVVAVQSGWLR